MSHSLHKEAICWDFRSYAIEYVFVDVDQQDLLFDLLKEKGHYSMNRD